ncbi:MAG TPA: glycosyltransferase family 4 protein [Vicinamibacterales bacterium]
MRTGDLTVLDERPANAGVPAVPSGRGRVCMIAYTNYAFDARVRREAETLVSSGYRVLCLTTSNSARPARYRLGGVEIRELGVPKYRGKSMFAYLGSYLRFLIASSVACLWLMAEGRLDVVHVHNLPDFLVFAGLLPRLGGSKVVLDVHDSVPETYATKFASASLMRKALELEERLSALVAHRVVCVNQPQRETLVARGIPRTKTFISMNVPDPRIFTRSAGRRAPVAGNEHFNLVYHGTMAERLGVDLIIRAVARLRDRIPGVRLHLWGGGDDLAGFQQLARDLRIDDRVVFVPKGVPIEELPYRLAEMDLGVVGNRRSVAGDLMLPVKLMEYVALRVPAVAPRLRTIQHYFADDMVTYYDAEDVESMADAISTLYHEPELRARQAQRAGAFLDQYGWERQGVELVNFYHGLVES